MNNETINQDEKDLILKLNETVNEFIVQWKKSPYLWDTEMDIHVDLASSLKNVLREHGHDKQWAFYSDYGRHIEVSLISCAYHVDDNENNSKRSFCRPDIQIFKKADPKNPPDSKAGENWPLLWVCEIKYKTELGGTQNKKDFEYDKDKLKRLRAEYCCVLHFERTKFGAKEPIFEKI